MFILQNAVDSIAIGLEDYSSEDPRRLISATRNIFAGILLLFKHKLSLLSPQGSDEVLIRQQVLPSRDLNGNLQWTGRGKKTVDVQQIKERFESLGIKIDWDRVDNINQHRNDIEHYYSTRSKDSVRKLISDCFVVIRDFIVDHLGGDPKEVLGDDAWEKLVEVAEVYEREKAGCESTMDSVDWESSTVHEVLKEYECSKCGSGLIYIPNPKASCYDNEFVCKSCGESWDYESIATEALESIADSYNYRPVKDGGEPEIVMCPNCSNETYIFSEEICGVCGETAEHRCNSCSNKIPASEIFLGGLCSYCQHMLSKDD